MSEGNQRQERIIDEKGIDRRSFLGAGVLAVAGIAGAMAGCTPKTIEPTGDGTDGGAQAQGGDGDVADTGAVMGSSLYPWLPTEPVIDDANVEEEVDCDVIVIGLGVSGVAATRAAAEEKVKVVAFEKSAQPNSRSSAYCVIGGEYQEYIGRNTDFANEIAAEFWGTMHCYPSLEIWRRWSHGIADVFSWWAKAKENLYVAKSSFEKLPPEAVMELEAGGYVLMPNNFPLPEFFNNKEEKFPYYDACFNFIPDQKAHVIKNMDLAVAAGAEPYYGHFVEKLIFESGRVVGCYARSAESGKYVKARASKGVVLASGDYGSNEEMMEYFVPAVRAAGVFTWWPDYDVEGNPTDTGDGYKLGAWINAAIQPYHAPQIHWMGANEGSPLFESGAPEGYSAASDPVGVVGGSPYLQINLQGKRFMNEDIPGQELEFQIESQPGRQILQILDSGWKDQLAHFHPNNSNVAYALDEEPTYSASWYLNDARLERKLANGSVAQADTFEELLDYYPEFDKEEALKSIARYNELALKGKDEDFSKRSDRLFPLNKPPYYAAKGGVAPMLTSMGGLMSDKEAHVYDNDGVIIPGIYVAGNIQGSRFAFQYPMYPGTGVGHSITLYYGYVAGKNVVAGI